MSTHTSSSLALLRTRWAAIGAAVAVSLGAGGFGLANAAIDSGEKPVTVTTDTERVLDTRTNLGLSGRFADATPRELKVTGEVSVAGSTTKKVVVPEDAVGVLVNVTVVAPSHNGFLSLRPGGATGQPATSTVNFAAGGVYPNAATVDLGPGGTVQFWVETSSDAGNAHVLLDIVGYTVDHTHDDRYYTESEVDAAVAAAAAPKANSADVYTKTEVDALLAAKSDEPSGSDSITIPSSAFAPASESGAGLSWEIAYHGWYRFTIDRTCVIAPVFLPDGATITTLEAVYYNSTDTGTASTILGRYAKSNQAVVTMATLDSTTTIGSQSVSTSSVSNAVISDDYTYTLYTCFTGTLLYLDYVEIEFTYAS